MLTMDKKPKGRPKGRRPAVAVQVRMPPDVSAAIESLAAKNHRTRNGEIMIAVEKHLRDEGVWPHKEAKQS